MSYFCNDCECVFTADNAADHVETHGFSDGMYEHFIACPCCGSVDISNGEKCRSCGKPTHEDELYSGYCRNCLEGKLSYDNAMRYLQERDCLGSFYCWWLNDGYEPDYITEGFKVYAEHAIAQDYAYDVDTGNADTLDALREYIMDDALDFSEWLADNDID